MRVVIVLVLGGMAGPAWAGCEAHADCREGQACVAGACVEESLAGPPMASIPAPDLPDVVVRREGVGQFAVLGESLSWRELRSRIGEEPGTLAEVRAQTARRMEVSAGVLAGFAAAGLGVGGWATYRNLPPEARGQAADPNWRPNPGLAELQRASFMVSGFALASSVVIGALVPSQRMKAARGWAAQSALVVRPEVSWNLGGGGAGVAGRF